jgi:hypothetical protein
MNKVRFVLQEVEGRLPEEKEKMLRSIDRYLSFPKGEKDNFRLGKRAGVYQSHHRGGPFQTRTKDPGRQDPSVD